MQSWYITSIRPTHPQTGDQTIITLREYDHTHQRGELYTLLANIPHRFFTTPQKEETINSTIETTEKIIRQILTNSSLHLQKKYYHQSYILTIDGPKEAKHLLPPPFVTNHKPYHHRHLEYSPSTYLRYLYPLLTTVNDPSTIQNQIQNPPNKYIQHPKPALETLLNDTHVTLDIELEGWQDGKDQIFMVIYLSPTHKLLLHNLPFNIPHTSEPNLQHISLVRFKTQPELGELITELIRTDDPLWIFGHNIMSFDQIKIRNITKSYFPGSQGRKPVIKSVQGLGKTITQGRFTIDTYKYAKNHLSLFKNAKLETMTGFEKSIDYNIQEQLLHEAKKGNIQTFETLANYCIYDGIHAQSLALQLQRRIAHMSLLFGRDPDTICATSLPTIVNDHYERRHFYVKGYPSQKNLPPLKRNIPAKEYVHNLLIQIPNQAADKSKNPQKLKFQPGFHPQSSIFTLTPFVSAAEEFLKDQPIYQEIANTKDPIERLDYIHLLQELFRPIFEQSTKIINSIDIKEVPASLRRISKRYGLKPLTALKFMYRLQKNIDSIRSQLHTYTYLNSSPLIYIVSEPINIKTLEENSHGCFIGRGPVLSVSPGRFVADPKIISHHINQRIYQGINTSFHTKSTFEKNTLQNIIDQFFNLTPYEEIKHHLTLEIQKFEMGEKPIQDYYITTKTRSFYRNEFANVLANSTSPDETKKAFLLLTHRIHDHFSPECKKELTQILQKTITCFAYPYLQELHEKIIHPYPPSLPLILAAGTEYTHKTKNTATIKALARPITEGHQPSLTVYKQKAEKTFADIQKILKHAKPTQTTIW